MTKLIFISKKEYQESYSIHKKHYWERKFNGEGFDIDLIKIRKNPKAKEILFKENIDNINLELSAYCNRLCNYCPVSVYKRNYQSFFDNKLLEKILKELASIDYDRNISLNLYNEPLANKTFFINSLKNIKKVLPKTILQTSSNGDYIKDLNYLKDLEKYGLNKLKITLHPPKNKIWDFKMMETFFQKYLLRFNIKIDKKTISQLNCYLKIGNLFIIIQCPNWSKQGNNRGNTVEIQKKISNRTQPCVKPFREFTIFEDGTITQCCEAFSGKGYKKNLIGKVNKLNSIFDLYTSEILAKIRLELFDWSEKKGICSTCLIDDLSKENDNSKRIDLKKTV